MARPNKCRIGSLDYEIRWEGSEWQRTANSLAQIDCELQIIRMPDGKKPDITACSFVHEVTHGLLFYAHNGRDLVEELVCDTAGYLLTAFWRDNPDIFDWWIDLVKGDLTK